MVEFTTQRISFDTALFAFTRLIDTLSKSSKRGYLYHHVRKFTPPTSEDIQREAEYITSILTCVDENNIGNFECNRHGLYWSEDEFQVSIFRNECKWAVELKIIEE